MATNGTDHILPSFLCLILLFGTAYSQTDKLLQGQLLKDGDQLVSAFGNFRLGFFSPPGTTKRYLGIWYYRSHELDGQQFYGHADRDCYKDYYSSQCARSNRIQPVWVANRDTPVSDKSGRLTINSTNGNLQILHNKGNPTLISSVQGGSNTSAFLDKSGNFILYEMNSNGSTGRVLWQSFDYPTDTLLPGMKLGINWQSRRQWYLNSWITESNPANGAYTLRMALSDQYGTLLIRSGEKTIWQSGYWLNGSFTEADSPNIFYNFSYTSNEQEKYFNYSVNEDVTSFPALILSQDGHLRFVRDESSETLEAAVFGRSEQFFETIAHEEKRLWQHTQLFIGILVITVVTLFGFYCYRKWREYKLDIEEEWWKSLGIVLLIPLLCYHSYLILRKLKIKVESIWNRWKLLHELGDNISVSLPITFGRRKSQHKDQKQEMKIFDFQIIAAATNNFSATNKLGQGGFGAVYKGKLPDGPEIAVKKLSKSSGQGIVEFKNEAKLIAKLQHTNLVRLLGCSLHGGERILVYEYLRNKSLDFFLFDSSRENLLNLKKRLSIIEGIAQGLIYLHKYSRLKVIHRDLKSSNILLDDQMNPKISDFGLARAFGVDELEANTNRIVGTHGYMSPEYVLKGVVSMKTDVYSFGVMVLEIMSCKKNSGCYDPERPLNLVGYAWQLWNEGKGLELIEQTMDECCCANQVLRYLHVGLLCVQDQARDRPTMLEVISMLTNETTILPAPKQPAFFINVTSQEPQVPQNKFEICSANNVTISEMEGRGTTDRYLGIWYYRAQELDGRQYYGHADRDCYKDYYSSRCALNNRIQPVWVANRNTPMADESGRLTISSTNGNLQILHNKGNPIAISSVEGASNTSAFLDKSGNFIPYEMNSNGPTGWVLPGMKLGINWQSGRQWYLHSWITENNPANGTYTLSMDLSVQDGRLMMQSGEKIIWQSGYWQKNGSFAKASLPNIFYNFSYTSNEQEQYFNYSVNEDVTPFPTLILNQDGHLRLVRDKRSLTLERAVFGRSEKLFDKMALEVVGAFLLIPLLCYHSYLILRKLKTKVESIWNRWKLSHELGDNISVSLPITFGKRKSQHKDQKQEMEIFDFQIIAAATNNFSATNKLGQGDFGTVYKGKLPDGQEIAVKKLSQSSGQGVVEFKNEAKLIAKLQHTNLVRLLGCSLHGGERVLVYEYMPNKSLDFFLFDSSRKNSLNLKKQLSIIEGIVQGLIYLHKYSRLKVIHKDLKSSNILDDQMNPKISDFGLARAFGVDELEANTNRIVGTHGYMSPEYVLNGVVSMKTDVYSFGVMVLEIVSCKKINGCDDVERPLNLVGYAWQLWNEGKGLELIEQTMDECCCPNQVLRYLHVGLLRVQDQARDRPTMLEVISMLANETMILPAPKQPAFFINVTSQEPQVPQSKFEICSANNVTISEIEGR
ncbi:G-type lectin S-receptor-like serine/threonine-protein kinase At1g67520 [Mangifera indica]|uniref:G-type lectin S-receptor-like serine/threonine-protein kinase At1g67520 n=1 Tax=Mangifera indica TaxID=29780 RepID=UPI001CF9913E|nr:G-type lectin S-receptor-like serine/threonine-protein kinase At1g67520 [Mangifera indica]